MNTIILGSILLVGIGMLLAGLFITIRVNIKNEDSQERLNNRILDSLPKSFGLDRDK